VPRPRRARRRDGGRLSERQRRARGTARQPRRHPHLERRRRDKGDAVCVSGDACKRNVDDVGYLRALLADIGRRIDVDPKRVYATGFSNGAALAHRLACDAADLFAAVAAGLGREPGGARRLHAVATGALLVIHGTLDRCWPYAAAPAPASPPVATSRSPRTLAGWAQRNGCRAEPVARRFRARRGVPRRHAGRAPRLRRLPAEGALEHLEVVGNGHFWPDGHAYAARRCSAAR
jgi:polyhydroxybutyrate depolymerase